ncbi:hypothetical protein GQX73_g8837 [Xylaria multiplex]|uniref:Uncharacterized protein n=1 Tax=Xylaria multiplex TaxID=323545 RepID=A0A7C8IIV0_9PEZI|nr:hypothetical protein GQX73_g8837 [Xylaria multiplex]
MEAIAIVGLSFRLPQGILDEDGLWDVLREGKNLSSEWPSNRLAINAHHDRGLPARGAHFMHGDPGAFDAPFFSMTPAEATAMDPQQRWALETAYHAFENTGTPIESLRGSHTAVFGAVSSDDYLAIAYKDPHTMPRTIATGTSRASFANRISWYFDLQGPSLNIDTACSSSVVALDLACQSLRSGEASAALVLASNALLTAEGSLALANMGFLSPDSRCYSFDHRANGFARGEGIVALVVKPLSRAIQGGDRIRALIRATGVNQDGHTPTLTQPSPRSQAALIRDVYRKAGLDPSETRYVEAHGTGTQTGDPLEIEGIGSVFSEYRSAEDPLYVTSVKANIGHLEAASGLAGIVKTLQVLERGTVPPQALLEKLNPTIKNDSYNISIPMEEISWPTDGLRRASINSFGFGGTNGHAIMDDACYYLHKNRLEANHSCRLAHPQVNGHGGKESKATPKLLVWTAADRRALDRTMDKYEAYFENMIATNDVRIQQLAYTLATRRSVLLWRTFAAVDSKSNALVATGRIRSKRNCALAFVFAGQGAQYPRMGVDLLCYPVFEHTLRDLDSIFGGLGCKWSLLEKLHSQEDINLPHYSQPLTTALQVALVQLLKSFGIVPVAVVGHSSGEIAAAFAAGALCLESACKVAYYRGQAAERIRREAESPGAMMAVNLAEADVSSYLSKAISSQDEIGNVVVACVNSPSNCTLSGPEKSIDFLKERLEEDGIFARKLNTGVAYHSTMMESAVEELIRCLGDLRAGSDVADRELIPMVSSVTGNIVAAKQLRQARYWTDNLVSPVKFSEAVLTMSKLPVEKLGGSQTITELIEVSSSSTLRRPVLDSLSPFFQSVGLEQPKYYSVLTKPRSPVQTVLELAGSLFCLGYNVSITAVNSQSQSGLSPLAHCPPYPFDKSLTYWSESRLSADFRTRAPAPMQPLGIRSNDWNPLLPKWRNILTTESLPWIQDHILDKSRIMPGMASLIMMTQAVQDYLGLEVSLSGFMIKEASFLSPIIVNEEAGKTEVVTYLRQVEELHGKELGPFEVQIFTHYDNSWNMAVDAVVYATQNESQLDEVDGGQEARLELERKAKCLEDLAKACTRPIDSRAFYQYAQKVHLEYGDTFKLLSNIRWDGGYVCAADIDQVPQSHPAAGNMLHATVLDTALHAILVQLTEGMLHPTSAVMPHRLTNTWISATGWQTKSLKFANTVKPLNGSANSDSAVNVYITNEDGLPIFSMEELKVRPVTDESGEEKKEPVLIHGMEWMPQLKHLSAQQLQTFCEPSPRTVGGTTDGFLDKIRASMILSLRRTMKALTPDEIHNAPEHIHHKYLPIMQHFLGHEFDHFEKQYPDLEALLRDVDNHIRPGWALATSICRQLKPILAGKMNVLEAFFEDSLVGSFYDASVDTVIGDPINKFLNLATHECPIRLLEVGAGTGSLTKRILPILGEIEKQDGSTRFSDYTYTDISPGFFENAQCDLQSFKSRLIFKTFDLELDACSQGYEPGSYDMIIASSVLHATSDLSKTLSNLRQLLKSNGHLVFIEVPLSHDFVDILWGLLPGWWLSKEEWRQNSPLITEKQWDDILRRTGFSGNELEIRDCDRLSTLLVSRAISEEQRAMTNGLYSSLGNPRVFIVVREDSRLQNQIAEAILGRWEGSIVHPNDAPFSVQTESDVTISLLEVGSSLLAKITEKDFYELKALLQQAYRMLWVTSTNQDEDTHDPYSQVATGLFRTLQSEWPHKHMNTLSVEVTADGELAPRDMAEFVFQVLQNIHESNNTPEREFAVRDKMLHTLRVREQPTIQDEMRSLVTEHLKEEPWRPGRAVTLDHSKLDMPDSLQFIEDTLHSKELGAKEVEIETKAWAVNFRDALAALGRLEGEELGFECVGEVRRTGSNCQGFQAGDRVIMVRPGCFRTFVRGPAAVTLKVPSGWSYEEAVSAINPAATAFHCLMNLARLQKGERILIHSAAGSTGQMAIRLAKSIGAEIFATVGFGSKRQFLTETFGIPGDHIFYSRNTSFAQAVKRMTGGAGVDVVLNSLSGQALRATWDCIAPFGRFVELGKSDINSNSSLPMVAFRGNVSFMAFDLRHLTLTQPKTAGDLYRKVVDLLESKQLYFPTPRHVFPISQLDKALRLVQAGKHLGRVIATANDGDLVPKLLRGVTSWTLEPNASYLIAGGLGGIGRSISKWMIRKGARNLILLSRSGVSSKAVSDHVADMEKQGVNIFAPRVDIASTASLCEVLEECYIKMPPIRGCVNSANSLNDTLFEDMTHKQWNIAVKTKVNGSYNLHKYLPDNLDFFIMLSSISGIVGNPGQCNYASGCTYQDELARHRVARGQKAICIDIGYMPNVGIIAERVSYRRAMEARPDLTPIAEDDLLALLDMYCDATRAMSEEESRRAQQVLIGFRPHDDPTSKAVNSRFARPQSKAAADAQQSASDDDEARFRQAESDDERLHIVLRAFKVRIGALLCINPNDIDESKLFSNYGVDSLVAVELRTWIRRDFKSEVSIFDIMGQKTIAMLASIIIQRSLIRKQ